LTAVASPSLIGRMGRHQQDIDELARMERICLDLAGESRLPLERAGLLAIANNYRARSSTLRPAMRLPTQCPHRSFSVSSDFVVSS
jgi:hypothetical protein